MGDGNRHTHACLRLCKLGWGSSKQHLDSALTTTEPAAPHWDGGRLSAKPVESPEVDTMTAEPRSLATATDEPGSRLRIRSVKAPESVSATPVT